MKSPNISRRFFLSKAALVSLMGPVIPSFLYAGTRDTKKFAPGPDFLDQAPDGPVLKAGIVGCGGRGTGAAIDFLSAGPNLKIVALGDVFKDRLDECRDEILKQKGQEVPIENCFIGFDAYQKVIDSGVDVIILATPPYFRPEHMAAAIKAGKHVFAEKPVAVDPVGARSVLDTAQLAKSKRLSVFCGTQRRHQRDYVSTWHQVSKGVIGEIIGGNIYWNSGKLWHRNRFADWTEMEYMIRDWVNWTWLSGDHIVEQHVHNIDVMNWFTGHHPIKAVGFGSRHRRVTGDQFDNFGIDFVFKDGMHVHSMCRQINGCANYVGERMLGTKGYTNCINSISNSKGEEIWNYKYPNVVKGKSVLDVPSKIQEHIDFVTSIRTGKPVDEAERTAISTLTAIMGRVSAYTGKETTYEEILNSDLKLGPKIIEFGSVNIPKEIPVPGQVWTPPSKVEPGAKLK